MICMWFLIIVQLLEISLVQAQAGDNICVFTSGYGLSEKRIFVGSYIGRACVVECLAKRKTDPFINGVTVFSESSGKGCWCERKMLSVYSGETRYSTCFIYTNGNCVFGTYKDGSACCPMPTCPINCLDNTDFVIDPDGCTKCECSKCDSNECPTNCIHGKIKITLGGSCSCVCRTCAKLECPKSCEWGIETIKDGKGCVSCKCVEEQQGCGVVECPKNCPKGVMDIYSENGCRKCVCRKNICPTYNCPRNCKFSTEDVADDRGCIQCACAKEIVRPVPTQHAHRRTIRRPHG